MIKKTVFILFAMLNLIVAQANAGATATATVTANIVSAVSASAANATWSKQAARDTSSIKLDAAEVKQGLAFNVSNAGNFAYAVAVSTTGASLDQVEISLESDSDVQATYYQSQVSIITSFN